MYLLKWLALAVHNCFLYTLSLKEPSKPREIVVARSIQVDTEPFSGSCICKSSVVGGGILPYCQPSCLADGDKVRNFPEPPTPGIFSKVSLVQMGDVLRYK